MSNHNPTNRPKIGFFVHHQGRGHARRCEAIIEHLDGCQITIFSADPAAFQGCRNDISIVTLPDMIGAPARAEGLHRQRTPSVMHCVPLGVSEMRETFGLITKWMLETDPHLLFIDVSAELALLSRVMSVPAVKVRMHGGRDDPAHRAAYEACVGMLAPYHEDIEQSDYPQWARNKTYYTGGLCTSTAEIPNREAARKRLGLSNGQEVIVALSGAGGKGTPYASLTMGARALPDAKWFALGPIFKEGHETDFENLEVMGWVENSIDYLAAADVVVASAGDNTIHEIARMGRPLLCIPEWRYFDEQECKADKLEDFGGAVVARRWPGTFDVWQELISRTKQLDCKKQRELFDPRAAEKAAKYLRTTIENLWNPVS